MSEASIDKQTLERSHLEILKKLLSTMKYGSVTLIVQDGKVIQIDKTEKFRLKD
ncbi:MAG: YezD family protein [Ruminococcus sp.]|nr:YezD family protein [Ruminococcus sp.]